MAARYQCGTFPNGLAYLRLAGARRVLVTFPGLVDAIRDVTWGAWFIARYYRAWTPDFTLYSISRRRNIPPGFSVGDMAADYAVAVRSLIEREQPDDGRVDLMGLSLGGFVAYQFAADYPDLVRRLVIAVSAHKPGPHGPAIAERWLQLARARHWRTLYLDILGLTFTGVRGTLYRSLFFVLAPWLAKPPPVPTDLTRSIEACFGYDITDRLGHISAPTLVIGGTEDPFFPADLLRQSAARLRSGSLTLIPATGHGAFDAKKRLFDNAVLDFLRADDGAAQASARRPGEL